MRTLTDATRPDELTLLREDGLYALVSASTPPDVLALALEALAAHAGPPGRVDLVVHHRPTVTVRRPEERAEVTPLPLIRARCLSTFGALACDLPADHDGPHQDHRRARSWTLRPTIAPHADWTMSTPPRHQWTREHGRDVWHVDGGPCPTIPGSPYVRPYPPPHVRCPDCSEWLHCSG